MGWSCGPSSASLNVMRRPHDRHHRHQSSHLEQCRGQPARCDGTTILRKTGSGRANWSAAGDDREFLPGERRGPRARGLSGSIASMVLLLLLVLGPASCDSAAEGGTMSAGRATNPALARSDDPAVKAALAALDQGRPFMATRLLEPALTSSTRRTPEVVLLAATAASQWLGWSVVTQLLTNENWLDDRFDGAGRELLTRAALATNDDIEATRHAARAVATAASDSVRGVRLTLLARALDRRDVLDSSATAYSDAARLLPSAADWLLLRAAGVTTDSAARAALYARVGDTLARRRVLLVEAQALERSADSTDAATAYELAGEPVAALRLRARLARDDSSRRAIRSQLLRLVADRRGSAVARAAATELSQSFAPLTGAEALAVARSLATSGPLTAANDAFVRAASQNPLLPDDRLSHARLLFRLGRYAQAATVFGTIPAGHKEGANAAYERAVALLRDGRVSASRVILRGIEKRHPGDTAAIGRALFLLADLATDDGRDAAARETFRYVADRYPTSSMASRARFQAAMIAIASNEQLVAARELDTLASRYPRSTDAMGALYWAGRAWANTGDSATARARWRKVLADDPLSYYAVLAATRLDTVWWAPAPAPSPPATPASAVAPTLFARVDLLESMGMGPEASRERDRLVSIADSSTAAMLGAAEEFQARGNSNTGIALGRRALDRGAPGDLRTYRVIYPIVHGDVLAAEARDRELDPALVAALIRQESSFLASATSPAGARGLMQVMPAVGRSIARTLAMTPWHDALLYQPDVNLRLGTSHLASLVARYDELQYVLAAYNAGGSRVARWVRKGGTSDPELFVERIPFTETRDYVRIVTRNRAIYSVLYDWGVAD